jgi:osmotically-inducible protein OsmY
MKTSIKLIALLALGAGGVLSLPTGCAGTATQQSTGEYVDDAAVTAKVKTELIRDPVTKARQIDVTTFKGNVQLSGFVDTQQEKARAAQVAAGVSGVTNVTNNITVKAAGAAE